LLPHKTTIKPVTSTILQSGFYYHITFFLCEKKMEEKMKNGAENHEDLTSTIVNQINVFQ